MTRLKRSKADDIKWASRVSQVQKKGKKKKITYVQKKIALVKLQVGGISDANCCVSEHWALC